jgi:GMP synthase-like glutamine amidotransferase
MLTCRAISDVEAFVRACVADKSARILGICFGHQVLF